MNTYHINNNCVLRTTIFWDVYGFVVVIQSDLPVCTDTSLSSR